MTDEQGAVVPETGVVLANQEPITLDVLTLRQAKTWEDLLSCWMESKTMETIVQWYKGDIADKVVSVYGEKSLKKFAEDIHENETTIAEYRRVSRAFPTEKRGLNLKWTHYQVASYADSYSKADQKFATDERFGWIDKACDENWSASRLNVEMKKAQAITENKIDIFTYYMEYLNKVNHVLMHIDKTQLDNVQKQELTENLGHISNAFNEYMALQDKPEEG
jgi:hypothetical protein